MEQSYLLGSLLSNGLEVCLVKVGKLTQEL